MDRNVQELLDKQQIKEVLARYCRGCDRLDRKLLESVYWPEAQDSHGTFVGDAPGAIDFILKSLDGLVTQHFIGNILIEMESPTRARGETYVIALHQYPTRFHAAEFTVGARYIDKFEKRGEEWRIIDRTVVFDYSRNTPFNPSTRYHGMKNAGSKEPGGDPIHRVIGRDTKVGPSTVQDVIDKQQIRQLVMQYCRGADRGDRELFASVYWPEAIEAHGTYDGPAEGFVEYAQEALSTLKTQHMIGNLLIEMDGPTRAKLEAYVTAFHQGPSHFGGQEFVVGARYIDIVEKRNGEWKFISRTLGYDYSQQTPTTETNRYDGLDTLGKKYPDDLVYTLPKGKRAPDAQQALDRQAIEEVLMRYSRGIDRLDRKMLETVYWPEATDVHAPGYIGKAPGFIDWVLGYLKPMKTQHFLGNFTIDFDSPTQAHGETYVNAYHQIPTRFGAEELSAGARYLDKFEKRGSEWRIIDRVCVIDYSRKTAITEASRYDSITWKGGRFPDDPVYRRYG
jgi:3-phenylpropionate/cinnamic acid dioxygenase small subunit